jgi:hypothetical protein
MLERAQWRGKAQGGANQGLNRDGFPAISVISFSVLMQSKIKPVPKLIQSNAIHHPSALDKFY